MSRSRLSGSGWKPAIAVVAVLLSVCARAENGVAKLSTSRAGAVAHPPAVLVKFAESASTHDNMVKPVRLSDGRLLALSLTTHVRSQEMFGRYSSNDGVTWGEPHSLFKLPAHVGGFGYFDAFTDRDGEVHIFYLNDGNTGSVLPKSADEKPVRSGPVLDIWQVKSSNKATQWGLATSIWKGRAGDILSVVQLRNGRILLPISYMTDRGWGHRGGGFKQFTYVGSFSSSALYSDDRGETWEQSPDELVVPVPDLGTIGGVEPIVIELNDGRVWMLIRTQMGRFYESFSHDGGTHWSQPKPSSILASESPAALVRLPDQRIVMIWNEANRYPYAYGGRHVLHAAISSDEGRTWRGHREILRDPMRKDPPPPNGDWGTAYAFPVVTARGDLIFSTWVQTGIPRYLFRLDPRWLEETRQSTDFSQGVDDWSTFGTRGVELVPVPQGGNALEVRRQDVAWPSGAVWKFPVGNKGQLRLRLMLRDGFGGNNIGLTDHYSVPFDEEDVFYNVFNLPIASDGKLLDATMTANRWHNVALEWDMARGECHVDVDGRPAGVVRAQRLTGGLNYLRFHSTSDAPDRGLLVESVDANVSASWPAAARIGVTPARRALGVGQ